MMGEIDTLFTYLFIALIYGYDWSVKVIQIVMIYDIVCILPLSLHYCEYITNSMTFLFVVYQKKNYKQNQQ